VPVGVAAIAKRYQLPVIAIAGATGDDIEAIYDHGIDAAFDSVYKITTFDEIVKQATTNVIRTAFNVAASIRVGVELKRQ
jgi:glycerate kinase